MPETSWFKVGHSTHLDRRSGCTAIVFDRQVPAAVDVRGGAPGTRETTLLAPGNIGLLDAIVLSGGSAFGLQSADGVMRFLAEQGRGFQTRGGAVPLVSGAIIYDLTVGEVYHPTAADGYHAASSATSSFGDQGMVGAGCGATVAKMSGVPVQSGLGIAEYRAEGFTVTALVVLNAVGDIRLPASGEWIARQQDSLCRDVAINYKSAGREMENTTIGAVLVDAALDRKTLERVCISAQAALARCTVPAHTVLDGDTFYAAASSAGSPAIKETLAITSAAEIAVEDAIASIFSRG